MNTKKFIEIIKNYIKTSKKLKEIFIGAEVYFIDSNTIGKIDKGVVIEEKFKVKVDGTVQLFASVLNEDNKIFEVNIKDLVNTNPIVNFNEENISEVFNSIVEFCDKSCMFENFCDECPLKKYKYVL